MFCCRPGSARLTCPPGSTAGEIRQVERHRVGDFRRPGVDCSGRCCAADPRCDIVSGLRGVARCRFPQDEQRWRDVGEFGLQLSGRGVEQPLHAVDQTEPQRASGQIEQSGGALGANLETQLVIGAAAQMAFPMAHAGRERPCGRRRSGRSAGPAPGRLRRSARRLCVANATRWAPASALAWSTGAASTRSAIQKMNGRHRIVRRSFEDMFQLSPLFVRKSIKKATQRRTRARARSGQ